MGKDGESNTLHNIIKSKYVYNKHPTNGYHYIYNSMIHRENRTHDLQNMYSRYMTFKDNQRNINYRCVVVPPPDGTISDVGAVTYKKWIAAYLKHVKEKFGNIFPLRKTLFFDIEINKI